MEQLIWAFSMQLTSRPPSVVEVGILFTGAKESSYGPSTAYPIPINLDRRPSTAASSSMAVMVAQTCGLDRSWEQKIVR